MRLINASFEILTPIHGQSILRRIEHYARTAYQSVDRMNENSAERLVRHLIKCGHESVLEHVSLSVKFICDRGISHELVRHRLASFTQESTRYCNYIRNGITFIKPCYWSEQSKDFDMWARQMQAVEDLYNSYIRTGSKPQEARAILPNSTKTEIVVTANLREWRHILKLRTAADAHPQMRELMCPLLAELKQKIPVIFDDI